MEKPPKTRSKARAQEIAEKTHRTTGINLPADIWELLNRVAFERAKKFGGRPSVSALLVELVQRHRKELEKELGELIMPRTYQYGFHREEPI